MFYNFVITILVLTGSRPLNAIDFVFCTDIVKPYSTWNIRGLGEKEEELDKIFNENNIKIIVITESKKKLQGTKETEHYTVQLVRF